MNPRPTFSHNDLAFLSMLLVLIAAVLLAGCGRATATPLPGALPRTATIILPTGAPTAEPSPVSTRVLPTENFTPGPTPTITPIPDEVRGLVVEVLDGETIAVVMDNDPPGLAYEVRYIGIDAPPRDTPWGNVAYETNRRLTGMKVVRMVKGEQEMDEEGRLLRYVYLGNDLLSIIMVEQGLAQAAISQPNTEFQEEIQEAEARAREGELGLWGLPPTPTPTREGVPTPVPDEDEEAGTPTPEAAETDAPATEATAEQAVTGTPSTPDPEETEEAPVEEDEAES